MQRRWRDRNHPELVLATCRWDLYICWMLMLLLKRETGSVQPQMRQSVSSLTTLPAACLSNSSWKTCQGRTIEGRIYGDEMTCHPLSPLLREPRRRIRKKIGSVPSRKYLLLSQNVTFSLKDKPSADQPTTTTGSPLPKSSSWWEIKISCWFLEKLGKDLSL